MTSHPFSPHAIFSNTTAGDASQYDTGGSVWRSTDAGPPGDAHNDRDHPDLETLIQTPLQPGKTLIIYHPHAQHPPEIVDTATLLLARKLQSSLSSTTPWAPFSSRDEFEQAELFIKHNCTNGLINDQLHLNQKRDSHHSGPDHPPSMKNVREMHRILEEAGSDLDISLVC